MTVQFVRFLLVGGANFFLTLALFFLFLKFASFHYVAAFILASMIGVLFTYILNYLFVFLPEERLQFRERFLRYAFANCISIALNAILLPVAVTATGFDPLRTQFLLLPIIVLFNFATAKFWSLKPVETR